MPGAQFLGSGSGKSICAGRGLRPMIRREVRPMIRRGRSWEAPAFPEPQRFPCKQTPSSRPCAALTSPGGEGMGSRALSDFRPLTPMLCPSTVPPSVSIARHVAPGQNGTLKCLAYDFYPGRISLRWTGAGGAQEAESGGDVLPSGNGSYQSWVVVGVPPQDRAPHSCHVEHSSLAQPLTVPWAGLQELRVGGNIGTPAQ